MFELVSITNSIKIKTKFLIVTGELILIVSFSNINLSRYTVISYNPVITISDSQVIRKRYHVHATYLDINRQKFKIINKHKHEHHFGIGDFDLKLFDERVKHILITPNYDLSN